MDTFIYFTSLVFKLCQKQFSQKPTNWRGWHHPLMAGVVSFEFFLNFFFI